MTQEQKRIKLAEFAGWKCASHVAEVDKPFALMCWHRPGNNEWQTEKLPDYFNDLNAMHEAEKAVKNVWGKYVKQLNSIADPACATATQRAEALGKTLNLW